ncbi:eukaryotic translation initiation factor 5A, isoform CRA_h [Mus musculus]|nr:eukaryotic translation initiation factor 5A, isoform CRA_h [Mus musculus]
MADDLDFETGDAEAPPPARFCSGWALGWTPIQIYLTFYFGFPHPLKLSGRPCPSPSSLGQE